MQRLGTANFATVGSDELQETSDAAGGYAVYKQFQSEILKRAYEMGSVASRCRKIPIGAAANGIRIPYINESSRADGSRLERSLTLRIDTPVEVHQFRAGGILPYVLRQLLGA